MHSPTVTALAIDVLAILKIFILAGRLSEFNLIFQMRFVRHMQKLVRNFINLRIVFQQAYSRQFLIRNSQLIVEIEHVL